MANTLKFGNGEWYGKKDTILAYNDENNNYKPLPFDFSRASSATRVNKDGLIETVGSGEPRIDFQGNTKGSLLLEPSRSNVVDNSSNFFIGSWSGTRVNEGSTINAPNGIDEAHKLIATSVSNTHYREYTVSSASSGSYTGSCFFKKGEFDVACIRMSVDSYANRYSIYIDLNDGSFLRDATVGSPTGTSYKIEDYGNGWYRLSVSIIHTSGEVRMSLSNASSDYSNSNGLPVFLGNNSDGGYSWGAQLEQSSYATSYIPTSGSAVTRIADSCSQTPPSGIIGQTEGVLYAEISANETSNAVLQRTISLSDGTNNNRIYIGFNSVYNELNASLIINNTNVFFGLNIPISNQNTFNKIALKYKSGESSVYVNGVLKASYSNTFLSGILNQIKFNNRGAGDFFEGNCKDIRVYNTALTDNELQKLTQV